MIKNKYLYNITTSSLLLISILTSGCSNKNEILDMSEAHTYNEDYGVIPSIEADRMIAQELEIEKHPVKVDYSACSPNCITQIEKEPLKPDEFIGDNWTPPKPKIFYKYMDDPNFYSEDELPENKFRTSNSIIKVKKKETSSLLYSNKN